MSDQQDDDESLNKAFATWFNLATKAINGHTNAIRWNTVWLVALTIAVVFLVATR